MLVVSYNFIGQNNGKPAHEYLNVYCQFEMTFYMVSSDQIYAQQLMFLGWYSTQIVPLKNMFTRGQGVFSFNVYI